ncbi:MAG: oligoendopeptidase F [Defluviitaleaceae bacterium]|nr:oligoendopeptidase F [Defluviitaleaceae bacterium]
MLRSEIKDEYKWDLSSLYKNDSDWEEKYNSFFEKVDELSKFENTLGKSSDNLLQFFNKFFFISEEIGKILVYSGLKHDEDTTNSFYTSMNGKSDTLYVKFNTATSFLTPELISIGKEKIYKFIGEKQELEIYKHFFDNLFRGEHHILSKEKEEVIAMTGEILYTPQKIFSMINNADLKFEKVKDSNGKEVEVTHGTFINLLHSTDRVLRENVYKSYYRPYINLKNSIAESYYGSVKSDIFMSSVKKYPSSLESALFDNNISVDIYKNLIKTVKDNLHLFQKHLRLRKKFLKQDKLNMYDIFTPLVKEVDSKVTYEEAKETIIKALQPLGSDYGSILKKAFNDNWIDLYESKGKRSGAYSWGTYGSNPYILMNYANKMDDMFTLAHEIGHSIHSYYTRKTQPLIYGDYTVFLAEIASTLNESLLTHYLLKNTKDKKMYAYLINHFIENFRATLFRQTMFAEFEMITHEKAESNEPLTSDILNEIYKNLLEKYFGDTVEIDEIIIHEWSRVPHFYDSFYVYQYATGFSAAMSISKSILEEGEPAVKRYLKLLKSGSSNYSIELLKEAGIDMTSSKPIKDALSVFEDLIDKLEESLEVI